MNFEQWFAKVDTLMKRKFGFGADDFPDQTWRDWYDSEMTPLEAVYEAIANEEIFDD